jgi:hypothetical protein
LLSEGSTAAKSARLAWSTEDMIFVHRLEQLLAAADNSFLVPLGVFAWSELSVRASVAVSSTEARPTHTSLQQNKHGRTVNICWNANQIFFAQLNQQ